MDIAHIRNFSIIAHIDHGKSTLADRLIEKTKAVEERRMRDQVLDTMDLERERGITIKMQPIRMQYEHEGDEYTLNLIDTPGHIDFAYEVSRALKAVEGVLLLVDATQGVQAQTLTTLRLAQELGLVVIPTLSKVDAPLARVDDVQLELAELLGCDIDDVLHTSGKTGDGVEELIQTILARVPAPAALDEQKQARALVFDFHYSNHRGVIVFVRVFEGRLKKGDSITFASAGRSFTVLETGVFMPEETPTDGLETGTIGYIVTGIKEPGVASVGDTLVPTGSRLPALPGYEKPSPVIWASIYPESQDDFVPLRQALARLELSDSSLSYEEESSGVLGRGFRAGFLGMLHLEIVTERLRREFNLNLIVTSPSITYEVTLKNGKHETIYSPHKFPDHGDVVAIEEPWAEVRIMVPPEQTSPVVQVLHEYEAITKSTETFSDGRTQLHLEMPLRELMRNFFDRIKSVSAGFASLSYEMIELRPADVARLDVLVAEEVVPAFTRVVARRRIEHEAEQVVLRLHDVLPRQQFVTKIQAKALGRIVSSKSLSAYRKDVTAKLYGGDITRKMKLLEKQKKGKKKMLGRGKVDIPEEVFMKMMKGGE